MVFLLKVGGVSSGIYCSLNTGLGSKDQVANVIENRNRIARALRVSASNLLTVNQVHSTEIIKVVDCWSRQSSPRADGLVTNKSGIALAICTADCGPVLFADKTNGVIGAAHAGWRGAFNGVLEKSIEKMESLGASRSQITAVLGPTISANVYEVGAEFVEQFLKQAQTNKIFFKPSIKPNHSLFDLPAYIAARLNAAKIGTVSDLKKCTYSLPDIFFSYRRMLHNQEQDYGRLMSAIVLKE